MAKLKKHWTAARKGKAAGSVDPALLLVPLVSIPQAEEMLAEAVALRNGVTDEGQLETFDALITALRERLGSNN